jgi:hypothetical protein
MKYLLMLIVSFAICGCNKIAPPTGRYVLFESTKGTVYRLDTISGKTEITYSPTGWPTLSAKGLYSGEDGKTYEYQGQGKLVELSIKEAAEKIMEKYPKK